MKRTPIISGEGILNLIPQRPPIVMVDSFCGIEDNCSYSGLTVTDDNILKYLLPGRQIAGSRYHRTHSPICGGTDRIYLFTEK